MLRQSNPPTPNAVHLVRDWHSDASQMAWDPCSDYSRQEGFRDSDRASHAGTVVCAGLPHE